MRHEIASGDDSTYIVRRKGLAARIDDRQALADEVAGEQDILSDNEVAHPGIIGNIPVSHIRPCLHLDKCQKRRVRQGEALIGNKDGWQSAPQARLYDQIAHRNGAGVCIDPDSGGHRRPFSLYSTIILLSGAKSPMKNQLLVTAVGQDRPGIVARLTEIVAHHQGNLEASRMSILGGEFALIALVTIAGTRLSALETELSALSNEGILVVCKQTQSAQSRQSGQTIYEISLTGADHEGIVHKVSTHLRDHAINILRADTDVINAPETGTPLFTMQASIAVPDAVTYEALQADLAKIAREQAVDIDLAKVG